MINKIDLDNIIEQLLENESIGKQLNDDDYKKVIEFIKSYLFEFLLFFYTNRSLNSNNKKLRFLKKNDIKTLEEKILDFCSEFIRSINSSNVDLQLEILKKTINLFYNYS